MLLMNGPGDDVIKGFFFCLFISPVLKHGPRSLTRGRVKDFNSSRRNESKINTLG